MRRHVTVLIVLLPDARRGGHLGVILRVRRLRKGLLARRPWVVVARVVTVVGHRRGQLGFGGSRRQATGIVNRGDLSRRAHHGQDRSHHKHGQRGSVGECGHFNVVFVIVTVGMLWGGGGQFDGRENSREPIFEQEGELICRTHKEMTGLQV